MQRHLLLLFVLCLTAIATRDVGAADLTIDDLFPTDRVLDVRIEVSEEDWDTIRNQRRDFRSALSERRKFAPVEGPYTYVSAKVSIDGVVFPQVGLRKKGFLGSLNSYRPSLKVKLNYVDETAAIGELSNLTFNNNQQDTTLMSQFMGYALFNAAGSPAPRCSYARVTVNGQNLGVYSHVETARQPLLARGFGNGRGTLYEGTVTDFFAGWDGSFENKVGDDKAGRAHIRKLIAAMQGKPGDVILSSQSRGRGWAATSDKFDGKWTSPDFDDSSWRAGVNGAGYETQQGYGPLISEGLDFREEMHEKTASVYLRFPFDIKDFSALRAGHLYLKMKYDDGFVAYLNGHRIASSNAPEEISWESKATASHSDPAAMRFASFKVSEHRDKLRKGRNVLAVHGLNVDAGSTDMVIVAEMETNDHDDVTAIGELVEMDAFFKFWAIEGLLGFWDGYSGNRNNYFMYLNPETEKFHFMPWGADCMFEKFSKLEYNPAAPLSVKTNGLIAHKLYQSKAARARYAEVMNELLAKHWDEQKLLAEVDRIAAMVKPHLSESQKRTHDPDRIRKFIRDRRAEVEREVAGVMPIWTNAPGAPPVIPDDPFRRGPRGGKPEKRAEIDTIWNAAKNGDLAGVKKHLGKGLEVDARDPSGGTPLAIAALLGREKVVDYLITKGANVNHRNGEKQTPLHGSAFLGQVRVVELLIENGADVNARNNMGETPLNSASGKWEDIKGFVDFIAGILNTEIDQKAVKEGRPKVVALLEKHGGKLGVKRDERPAENRDVDPIWIAVRKGDLGSVRKRLESGVKIDLRDTSGNTPLAIAALLGRDEIVEFLISKGAEVNLTNNEGQTALHSAAFLGQVGCVELLIEHKANLNAANKMGETPLDVAATGWREVQGIVEFLSKALQVEIDQDDVKTGRPKVVALLKKNGAKPGKRDQ